MSEIGTSAGVRHAADGADGARRSCRRMLPDTYRCACGRVRDRCVRSTVRALWSGAAVRPARPARP
ncbi:hypothetical protein GA0070613_0474 [Micromonospora inositola]|uniref:Uncharacterized protein n=1 Tax=Micromonospora inositola TaxID=47865 RepID=A0A1C5GW69_9ACTN|nr:hypothetical protein GA0070613_0474 [Micromonospora inositola]